MSAGVALMGVQLAGTLLGGLGQRSASRAEAAALDENGRRATLAGEEQVAATYRESRQVIGAAQANIAGSGVVTGTGTAADLIRESVFQSEMEVVNIRNRASGEAAGYAQAAADARHAGDQALIGSAFSALGTGLQYQMGSSDRARLRFQRDREFKIRLPRGRTPGTRGKLGVLSLPGGG